MTELPDAPRGRLVVALSGGVDSAVAAALLVEAGHDVVAVHVRTGVETDGGAAGGRSCCGVDDARDAREVAARLGIPFYVVDAREAFGAHVLGPFVAAYAAGLTPNPCVACNQHVKFGRLLELATGLGAAAIATGHYARCEALPSGRHALRRAADPRKDQTYVLHGLDQAQLSRAVFPLGGLTKAEVRARARALGLPVADKPDSQELCFVPDGDVRGWLARAAPGRAVPGEFLEGDGRVAGTHASALGFTRGQRRGLPALGTPRYVARVEPLAGRVHLAPREALLDGWLEARPTLWSAEAEPPPGTLREVAVQVRHAAAPVPGLLRVLAPGHVGVELSTPVFGAAEGQALVAYVGDQLLCGGPLTRLAPQAPAAQGAQAR